MKLDEKQNELDLVKWQKSERLGFDACGSFNYCYHCDKSKSHPCARACFKMDGIEVEDEVTPIVEASKNTKAKKATTTKKAEKTTKKTTKSTTKKPASKTTKKTK